MGSFTELVNVRSRIVVARESVRPADLYVTAPAAGEGAPDAVHRLPTAHRAISVAGLHLEAWHVQTACDNRATPTSR